MLKEIKRKQKEEYYTGNSCPSCGGALVSSTVPCPDGKEGCLVIHQGYKCLMCGKYFTN